MGMYQQITMTHVFSIIMMSKAAGNSREQSGPSASLPPGG